jgi:hypothetical protein
VHGAEASQCVCGEWSTLVRGMDRFRSAMSYNGAMALGLETIDCRYVLSRRAGDPTGYNSQNEGLRTCEACMA